MKRFPLMVAAGALGLALLAGVTRELSANAAGSGGGGDGGFPSDDVRCYHTLYSCSYGGDMVGWWGGCDTAQGEGWIPTGTAKAICTTYHTS